MKKKIASLALVLALCLSLLPVTAFAEGENEDSTEAQTWGKLADTSWYIGHETDTEYHITTAQQLAGLAKLVNEEPEDSKDPEDSEDTEDVEESKTMNFAGKTFYLDNDLDLSGHEWIPIAGKTTYEDQYSFKTTTFSATFYGNGHVISGLDFSKVYGQQYVTGLFGTLKKAKIYDLTVNGTFNIAVDIEEYRYFGSIAGMAENSLISNCVSEVTFNYDSDEHWLYGEMGMIGQASNSTIEYCENKGDYTFTSNKIGSFHIGGIVGGAYDNTEIRYCANTGAMTLLATASGEIVGVINGKIDNCYATGNLTVLGTPTKNNIGGIAGEPHNGTTISNSYFAGELDLSKYSVQLTTEKPVYMRLGGITGQSYYSTDVINCSNDYYTQTANVFACGRDTTAREGVSAKSVGYMKTEKFYDEITKNGGNYRYEADSTPLLPKPTHKVSFVITPENLTDVVITVDGEKVTNPAELENGRHKFTVEAQNCKPFSGEFTVSANPETHTQTVAMTYLPSSSSSGSSRPRYDVTTPSKPENGAVTVDPERARSGSRVTVTVTPDSGYKLGELVVTDKDGKKLELTDKGNGQYTFTMPSGKVEVAAEFVKEVEVSPFADVATDAYYYDAVKWAVEKGVTNGVSETLFGPDQACTRAQIVTFLWRAAGSPEPKSGSSFADVAADAYYAKAVAWAVENGITKGTSETTFHPDETCTRAQGVTFLYRALGKLAAAQAGFMDVAADSYYADAVNWAAENGVTKGISETLFGPDGSCTRAQIVTFLYRAYQGK